VTAELSAPSSAAAITPKASPSTVTVADTSAAAVLQDPGTMRLNRHSASGGVGSGAGKGRTNLGTASATAISAANAANGGDHISSSGTELPERSPRSGAAGPVEEYPALRPSDDDPESKSGARRSGASSDLNIEDVVEGISSMTLVVSMEQQARLHFLAMVSVVSRCHAVARI